MEVKLPIVRLSSQWISFVRVVVQLYRPTTQLSFNQVQGAHYENSLSIIVHPVNITLFNILPAELSKNLCRGNYSGRKCYPPENRWHSQIEDALEVIDLLAHCYDVVWNYFLASDHTEVPCIPIHMFHHLRRLGAVEIAAD